MLIAFICVIFLVLMYDNRNCYILLLRIVLLMILFGGRNAEVGSFGHPCVVGF